MDKKHIESETQYKIEVSDSDYNWDYVDPLTSAFFQGTKKQAEVLAFMLTDQHPDQQYIVYEVKPQ